MTRYLRLGWIVPRALLLVLAFFVAQWGAGWALRTAVVSGGQAAVGAKVDLADGRVDLLRSQATLRGLAIANPRKPMENLLEADLLELDFETDSLLRKKVVAKHGVVRGLRFGGERVQSGALPDAPVAEGEPSGLAKAAGAAATSWLADIEDRLSTEAVDDFQSVHLAEELADRWPARFESLKAEAEALKTEVGRAKAEIAEAKRNPLRHVELLAQAPQRVADMTRRLEALRAAIASAPAEVEADRRRIAEARASDERLLRERLQPNQLDPDSLTTALLGDRVTGGVAQVVAWVEWTRKVLPSSKAPKRAEPARRGMDVRFVGLRPRPDLLVRTLDLQGVATFDGRPFEVTGVVTDITTEPALAGKPMRIALKSDGPSPIDLRVTLDRTGAVAIDELFLDCPSLPLPRLSLGGSKRLSLEAAPTVANLSVRLRVEGSAIVGEARLVQDELRVAATMSDDLPSLARRFGEAFATSLDRLPPSKTRVQLAGTLRDPQLAIQSTLGPALTQAAQQAFRVVATEEAEKGIAKARSKVDAKLTELTAKLEEANRELIADLEGPAALLSQLGGGAPRAGGFSIEQLGRGLKDAGLVR